jgi:hypothetical protein
MPRLSILFLCVSLSGCAEDEAMSDGQKPQTFFDSCQRDAECKAPFSCLQPRDLTAKVCTQTCEETADCPTWVASGHCAGTYQSPCVEGVCEYGCE